MSNPGTNRLPLTRFAIVVIIMVALGTMLPLAVLSWSAPAQNSSGQLSGTVSDATGETVSRATVIISTLDRHTQGIMITDAQGVFVFSGIPAGAYVLQVFANGFAPSPRIDVELQNRNVRQDVTMDIRFVTGPRRFEDTSQSNKQYTGEMVSIDVNDLNIRAFFRWIYEVSGMIIAVDTDARERLFDRTVTLYLQNVPWDQVLDDVVTRYGLRIDSGGDLLRINGNPQAAP